MRSSNFNIVDLSQTLIHFIINFIVYTICFPIYFIYLLYFGLRFIFYRNHLNKILKKKREECDKQFDQLQNNLDRLENQDELIALTKLGLDSIQDKLYNKEINPTHLLYAYQMNCLKLYKKGNSGICQFIEEADQMASQLNLSNYTKEHKSTLYGIPISVKEFCNTKGYDNTFGLIKRCFDPAEEDCTLIQVLKSQGAIPFVLTATSHLGISMSGINPVFGDMSNPVLKHNEPGGSSSGEGVLIKLGGSIVGIGTDIAGSIRIPSAFCGLAGLKPTSKRISGKNKYKNLLMPIQMDIVFGPMSLEVENLVKFMRTVLCPLMFNLDPYLAPISFDDSLYTGLDKPRLKIGYYDKLEGELVLPVVPSVRRAVNESVNYLRQYGHSVHLFNPPFIDLALELCMKVFSTGFSFTITEDLFGEPVNKHTGFFQILVCIPWFIKWLIDKLTSIILGKSAAVTRFSEGPRTIKGTVAMYNEILEYRKKFYDAWLTNGDFDVIICPVCAFPAMPKNVSTLFCSPAFIYSALYNILDFPAGSLCVGYVNQHDLDVAKEEAQQAKRDGNRMWKNILEFQKDVDLPLGIQVVGKPFQEEVVLRVMRELERLNQTRI